MRSTCNTSIRSYWTFKCLLNYIFCFFFVFYSSRENGPFDSRGDSAAGDGSERGAFSLPESPDRTPSPRGEIRRPEGGDGSILGEEHIHVKTHILFCHISQHQICFHRCSNIQLIAAGIWVDCFSNHWFSLPFVERLQTWPQENRLHPQQQRVRVHLQLRVRRIGRRFPCHRSKQACIKDMFNKRKNTITSF